jgi:N-acetylgalactosamine kinase
MFAARFKDKETADEFAKFWNVAREENKKAPAPSAGAAPAAAAAHVDRSGLVPQVDSLEPIYGAEKVGDMFGRYAALSEAFKAAHGREPSFFVRAPGRVNLIGEHVDYHGYSVLPMALATQDVVIAVSLDDSGTNTAVKLSNIGDKYAPASLPLDPSARVEFETGVKWHQYVQCGYKGAFEFAASKGRPIAPKPMLVTIDGRVPPGAGVSSSSALVVASFLAFAQVRDPASTRHPLRSATHKYAHAGSGHRGGDEDDQGRARRGMPLLRAPHRHHVRRHGPGHLRHGRGGHGVAYRL